MSAIQRSEGDRQAAINRATGEAQAILTIAEANAGAIKLIANAITTDNGEFAVNQKLAGLYIEQFGNLAKAGNTIILPQNLSDIAGFVATALAVTKQAPKS